jgi:uncharacterized protein (TIGR00251 family)
MAAEQLPFTRSKSSLKLHVKVIPRAGKNSIAGLRNGELVVRIQAPALRGEANKQLVKYLAKVLAVPKSQVEIDSGATSRHKTLLLPLQAEAVLEQLLL